MKSEKIYFVLIQDISVSNSVHGTSVWFKASQFLIQYRELVCETPGNLGSIWLPTGDLKHKGKLTLTT